MRIYLDSTYSPKNYKLFFKCLLTRRTTCPEYVSIQDVDTDLR